MPARAMGSAQICFGLVTIPVKIYPSAQSSAGFSFNLLHEQCGSRLKQQLYCPKHESVVERHQIIKGYDVGGEQYVTFTAEELKAVTVSPSAPAATKEIDLMEALEASLQRPARADRVRERVRKPARKAPARRKPARRAVKETLWQRGDTPRASRRGC